MAVGLAVVPTATEPWVVPELGDSETELDGDSDAEGEIEAEGLSEREALELGDRDADGDRDALELAEAELDGDRLAENDCDGESEELGDNEAEGLSEALPLAEGLVEAEGDSEADGESDTEAGVKLETTQPKTRANIGPETVNRVPEPTAPVAPEVPSKVIVLAAWIDQSLEVTGAPLLFCWSAGIFVSFC